MSRVVLIGLLASTLCCGSSTADGDDDSGVEDRCGAPLRHSRWVDERCVCALRHDWCSDEVTDFHCCAVEGKALAGCSTQMNVVLGGECFCDEGFAWCEPEDADDYSCCARPHASES